VQLVTGGSDIEVTPVNVYEYVRRYARHRMTTVAKQPLENIREGVFDVIPR
jgi:E3 ubiquitin-protein ligase EDD1